MFQRIRERFRSFCAGCYGADSLNRALLITGIVLLVISFVGSRFNPLFKLAAVLAYVPLVWSLLRMYSRDHARRRAENAKYLALLSRLKDRQHRYFRCPGCRQTVRVPRGKGKINIRCPKCQRQFIKKT